MRRSRESRVAELEARGERQWHAPVISFTPTDDPLVLHEAALHVGRVDPRYGVLLTPEPCVDDQQFDERRERGDYRGGRRTLRRS